MKADSFLFDQKQRSIVASARKKLHLKPLDLATAFSTQGEFPDARVYPASNEKPKGKKDGAS